MYLNPAGELGGAENSLLGMVASLRSAEPSWLLHVVAAADGPLPPRARALGATTEVVPFDPPLARLGERGGGARSAGYLRLATEIGLASSSALSYAIRLRASIRKFRPDVIHTNGLKMHLLGAWAAGTVPLVWHIHDYVGPRPMTSRLLRWHARRCAAAVANSHSVAHDVREAIGPRLEVVPIHNAVDLARFRPEGLSADLDRLAALPPAPAGTMRVGLLGTFSWWKGHDTFLKAIAMLPRDMPVRAYVIGDAIYQTEASQRSRDDLRSVAAALSIEDRVGFTGFVLQPETALRALDIVVHASTAPEPFGLVIAEAMACGRAVITSLTGGSSELVTPGVDALAYTPGDATDLAAHIHALVTDADRRARLGRAARTAAERAFDQTRLASEIIPVYQAAVRRHAGSSAISRP